MIELRSEAANRESRFAADAAAVDLDRDQSGRLQRGGDLRGGLIRATPAQPKCAADAEHRNVAAAILRGRHLGQPELPAEIKPSHWLSARAASASAAAARGKREIQATFVVGRGQGEQEFQSQSCSLRGLPRSQQT